MSSLIQGFQRMGNPFLDGFSSWSNLTVTIVWMNQWWLFSKPWREKVLNSTKSLSRIYLKVALDWFMTILKGNHLPSSKDLRLKQHQRQVTKSKCLQTMWHYLVSCTCQHKVAVVTWKNFLLVRFDCFHFPFQAWASSIDQTQSLAFWIVLKNLSNLSPLWTMTA